LKPVETTKIAKPLHLTLDLWYSFRRKKVLSFV